MEGQTKQQQPWGEGHHGKWMQLLGQSTCTSRIHSESILKPEDNALTISSDILPWHFTQKFLQWFFSMKTRMALGNFIAEPIQIFQKGKKFRVKLPNSTELVTFSRESSQWWFTCTIKNCHIQLAVCESQHPAIRSCFAFGLCLWLSFRHYQNQISSLWADHKNWLFSPSLVTLFWAGLGFSIQMTIARIWQDEHKVKDLNCWNSGSSLWDGYPDLHSAKPILKFPLKLMICMDHLQYETMNVCNKRFL